MRRWLLPGLFAVAIAYMGWSLLLSDHGYLVYREEMRQLQELQQQLEALKQQRQRLAREILRLRDDPEALEELVHRELGYVHPDEFVLILPDERKHEPEGGERKP